MLDLEAAVLESKYMFVDPATGHVKLLLLPVKHNNLSMDMFFRSMIFSIQYDPAEDVSYVTKILNYFNGAETFTTTDRGSDSTMPAGTTGTCAPDTGTAESDTDSAGTGADGSSSECSAGTAG